MSDLLGFYILGAGCWFIIYMIFWISAYSDWKSKSPRANRDADLRAARLSLARAGMCWMWLPILIYRFWMSLYETVKGV